MILQLKSFLVIFWKQTEPVKALKFLWATRSFLNTGEDQIFPRIQVDTYAQMHTRIKLLAGI